MDFPVHQGMTVDLVIAAYGILVIVLIKCIVDKSFYSLSVMYSNHGFFW